MSVRGPNNVGRAVQTDPTLLRYASAITEQKKCWELLRACWQWCANGYNNSQQVWDLQCIVGRIQPISLCNPYVMSVRGPNNVGRAVQTDPTLLRYASAITEQKKCWELLVAEKFDVFQTTFNNMQQGVQTDATCNIQQCWELLTNNAASVCTRLQVTIYPVIHIPSCRAWLQALMLVLPTGFHQLARISGYKGSSLSQFAVPNLTLFKMYLLTFFENCFKPVL